MFLKRPYTKFFQLHNMRPLTPPTTSTVENFDNLTNHLPDLN